MARASIPTILSLDQYSKIMGIIPPHFNQGTAGALFSNNACSDVWWQYSWMNADQVSREDLALEIHTAEEELANFVGYYPGPKYTVEENYDYPRYHRSDLWQSDLSNNRGAPKSINLRRGRFIGPGRRAVTFIDNPRVAYTDEDLDGFDETATLTAATTVTDVNELKVYFTGHNGDPEWEIRPERAKAIAAGVVTFVFYSWQMIDPDLWETFPTPAGLAAIDLTDATTQVATVDVYREYRDTTQTSAQFLWNPDAGCDLCSGTGCSACSYSTVEGCLYTRNYQDGIVVPAPAAYDASSGVWSSTTFPECRDPDMVKVWYLSGEVDERYTAGYTHNPLSDRWARIIAHMATARLERPFCSCGNTAALATWLREDLAFTPAGSGNRFTTQDVIDSPFGTRRGEVMAWLQVKRLIPRRARATTI